MQQAIDITQALLTSCGFSYRLEYIEAKEQVKVWSGTSVCYTISTTATSPQGVVSDIFKQINFVL